MFKVFSYGDTVLQNVDTTSNDNLELLVNDDYFVDKSFNRPIINVYENTLENYEFLKSFIGGTGSQNGVMSAGELVISSNEIFEYEVAGLSYVVVPKGAAILKIGQDTNIFSVTPTARTIERQLFHKLGLINIDQESVEIRNNKCKIVKETSDPFTFETRYYGCNATTWDEAEFAGYGNLMELVSNIINSSDADPLFNFVALNLDILAFNYGPTFAIDTSVPGAVSYLKLTEDGFVLNGVLPNLLIEVPIAKFTIAGDNTVTITDIREFASVNPVFPEETALEAYWSMDDIPDAPDGLAGVYNTKLIDYTKSGYNGSITGCTGVPGVAGRGLLLAATDRVIVENAPLLDTAGSISFFVKPTAEGIILSKDDNGFIDYRVSYTSGNINLIIDDSTLSTPIALGETHFITATFDGTHHKLYVDGRIVAFKESTKTPGSNAADLTIGNSTFAGLIDELRLYSKVLNANEILGLFTYKVGGKNVTAVISDYLKNTELTINDLTISGDLTVNGTTTTINTSTLEVEDNIITINKNFTGVPPASLVSGLSVVRGDSPNYSFMFRESDDTFVIGEGIDGTENTMQAVATREDAPQAAALAFWSSGDSMFKTDADLTYVNGTLKINDATISNDTTTGAVVVVGGLGVGGNLNVGGTLNISGSFSSTVNDANNNSITDVLTVKHMTTGSAAAGIGTGIVLATETPGATSEMIVGQLEAVATANNASTVSISTYSGEAVNFTGSRATIAGNLTVNGASDITADNIATLNLANNASAKSISIGTGSGTAMVQLGGETSDSVVEIPSSTASVSYGTGALVVAGGVGITGNTFTNGTLTTQGSITTQGSLSVNSTGIDTTVTGTFNVINTNATTINFGGVASSITIGKDSILAGNDTTIRTNLTVKGQLTSNITTGTAPLVINSTTLNTNLNADLLDGEHGSYYYTKATELRIDAMRSGFVNNNETTPSYSDVTNLFTLTPTGTTWSYYYNGLKYTITGAKSVSCTLPINYVSINSIDGTLVVSGSVWDLSTPALPVAIVYYNAANTPKYLLADERHTCAIDRRTHRYLHLTRGTQFISGGALTNLVANSDLNTSKRPQIDTTTIADEDLFSTLATLTPNVNGTEAQYLVQYRTAPTTWTWKLSAMPFAYNPATGIIQWDNSGSMVDGTGGSGGNERYYNSYILFTNQVNGPSRYTIVPGRGSYLSLNAAQAESPLEFDWTGLIVSETVVAYQLTWAIDSTSPYTSIGKCIFKASKKINVNYTATSSTVGVTHNTLAGLQGGDATNYYHSNQQINTTSSPTFAAATIGTLLVGNGAGDVTSNVVLGQNALNTNTTGSWNISIGYDSLTNNTTGKYNVAVGSNTLKNNVTGQGNTAIGHNALNDTTTLNNTGVGINALYSTTGSGNIAIGARAGWYETGSNKLYIDSAEYADEATGRANSFIYGDMSAKTLLVNADVTSKTFTSNVATGTAPLAVASTTKVTNLNADMLDNQHIESLGIVSNAGLQGLWTTKNTLPYPNDPAGTTYFQNDWATVDGWTSGGAHTVVSVAGGSLVATIAAGGGNAYRILGAMPSTATFRARVKSNVSGTRVFLRCWRSNTTFQSVVFATLQADTWTVLDGFAGDISGGNTIWFSADSNATAAEVFFDFIYVGTGAYLPNSLVDSSGNGNHGTIYGATPVSGGGLQRDGINDYEKTTSAQTMPDVFHYHEELEIPNHATQIQIFLGIGTSAQGRLALWRDANARSMTIRVWSGSADIGVVVSDVFETDATKVVADITIDWPARTYVVYKNGVLFAQGSLGVTLVKPASHVWYFGNQSALLSTQFTGGVVKGRRIYDRALSAEEVYSLYLHKEAVIDNTNKDILMTTLLRRSVTESEVLSTEQKAIAYALVFG